jgi:glucose-1-phosphate adenylyltransferase
MRDVAGIILTEGSDFGELTRSRSVAALPIAGRYRLIDFILSGMVNSGIISVGVITCYNYSSLMEHLGSGIEWDLQRKCDGLFILPPFISQKEYECLSGDIDMLFGAMPHIKKCRHRHIVVSKSNLVCNINFREAFNRHKESNADITMLYNDEDDENVNISNCTVLEVEGDVVKGMEYKPKNPKSKNTSMDTFIIERDLLISIIEECFSKGKHNFVRDVLLLNEKKLKICGWKFEGYVGRVDEINAYYHNNLNILSESIRNELFAKEDIIYTKTSNQAPARYGGNVTIKNSLVADGCFVEGRVENCILSRGVNVEKRALIKNSIIMENTRIEEGCNIKNAIIDKECIIRKRGELIGHETHPVIIRKGMVL